MINIQKGMKNILNPTFFPETKTQPKRTKKKRKGDISASSIEISKDFFISLLEAFRSSELNLSYKLYRRLLNHFLEALVLIESKTKNMFANRDLILNYLEAVFKMLIQKKVEIEYEPVYDILGKPNIFPLKVNFQRNPFYQKGSSKNSLIKLNRMNSLSMSSLKKSLFSNKKDLAYSLIILKKIALTTKKFLGIGMKDSLEKLTKNFKNNQINKQSKSIYLI